MEDSHNGVNPKEISMADKYEPKDGDMSVFPNDKGDNPARPDYTGKVLIEGKEYLVDDGSGTVYDYEVYQDSEQLVKIGTYDGSTLTLD
ncbi:MAG: hypothetical protein EB168_09340, partial [Euryarchaeota archaeon]|nr:hypothetical protein [Euryarchaeota archaeon]